MIHLESRHPRWPSYFDPDVLVYLEDWDILAEEHILLLGTGHDWMPSRVQLLSVTRLPDQLLFLNGIYLPEDPDAEGDEPDAPSETYYGICGLAQFTERAPSLLSVLTGRAGAWAGDMPT